MYFSSTILRFIIYSKLGSIVVPPRCSLQAWRSAAIRPLLPPRSTAYTLLFTDRFSPVGPPFMLRPTLTLRAFKPLWTSWSQVAPCSSSSHVRTASNASCADNQNLNFSNYSALVYKQTASRAKDRMSIGTIPTATVLNTRTTQWRRLLSVVVNEQQSDLTLHLPHAQLA